MQKIVDFPVQAAQAKKIENERLRQLYATWLQLKRANGTAALQDISSSRLRGLLAWMALARMEAGKAGEPGAPAAEAGMTWKYAGTAISRLAGGDTAGQEPFAACQRFERTTLRRLLRKTWQSGDVGLARMRIPLPAFAEPMHLEMLALPLRDTEAGGTVVMTIMQPLPHPQADQDELLWQAEGLMHWLRLTGLWTLREETPGADESPPAATPARVLRLMPRAASKQRKERA